MKVPLEWLKGYATARLNPGTLASLSFSVILVFGAVGPHPEAAETCGNGMCESGENRANCPQDCSLLRRLKRRLMARGLVTSTAPASSTFSLDHGGLKRTYTVHVPASYDPNVPAPVILVLHGGGGDGRGISLLTRMDENSERYGFLAVYPDGTGTKVGKKVVGSWNAGRCCSQAMVNQVDDVGFIATLLDQLAKQFTIDPNRIYATGHSNGSQMAFRLACELSERIAAIAPTGAQGVFDHCAPKRPVPVMYFHGTEDPCSPYQGGQAGGCFDQYLADLLGTRRTPYTWMADSVPEYIEKWKTINQTPNTSKVIYQQGNTTCVSYGSETNREVALCTTKGMGHTWPGGTYGKPCEDDFESRKCWAFRKAVGSLSDDLIANDAMWEFFKRHPLPQAIRQAEGTEPDPGIGVVKRINERREQLRQLLSLKPPSYHPEKYQSLTQQGRIRSYMIHVPPCYQQGIPIPVVLNFHGGGGTGESTEIQTDMNRKADRYCFIAVYPNAVSVFGKPGRQQHWNAGTRQEDVKIPRNPDVDDVGFISVLLDKLEREYSIDTKRVYASGLSNGAMMSYRVACELSERIAAIAPVGGGMVFQNCQPKQPVSIIHFHGTKDPGWPYEGGPSCFAEDHFPPVSQTISKWQEINNCSRAPLITYQKSEVTCQTYSLCDQGTEMALCTIEGGGHVWPGGYAFPSEEAIPWDGDCALGKGKGVGYISKDVNVVDAMWEFFTKHPKH